MAKILLVEDDNNLREIYEARLQAEGYDIVSAMDGEEALVVAKKEKPDLVISDVMMPRISGFEMLDILRNTEGLKDVKVIMLTALGQAEDKTRADSLGADRYLVKSQVTLEDIVKAAQELLGPADGSAATTPAVDAAAPAVAAATAAPTPEPEPTPEPAAVPTPSPMPTQTPPQPSVTPQPAVPTVPAPTPVVPSTPEPVAPPVPSIPSPTVPTPSPAPAAPAMPNPAPAPAEPTTVPTPTQPSAPAMPEPLTAPSEPTMPSPSPAPEPTMPTPAAPAEPTQPSTPEPQSPFGPAQPPAAAETPAPAPITPSPAPAADVTGTASEAQSTSAEEDTIKAQIESFVSQNNQTAPGAAPVEEPKAATEKPADEEKPEAPATPNNTDFMADAIKGLVADSDEGQQPQSTIGEKTIQPPSEADKKDAATMPAPDVVAPSSDQSKPAQPEQPSTPDDSEDDNVGVAHKKIISPITDSGEAPQSDLNALLAKEGFGGMDEMHQENYGTPSPQNPTGLPTAPHPPGHVISPNPSQPGQGNGVDPNSIAL